MKNLKLYVLYIAIMASTDINAQSWNLSGNAATDPAINFLGTTDAKALRFRTNNQVRMQITSGGKLGFGTGTGTPAAWFHIKGKNNEAQLIIDAAASQTSDNPLIMLRSNSGSEFVRISSDHQSNFFAGFIAGRNNNVGGGGYNNTFVGSGSGFSNSIGAENTALGKSTLYSNTEGVRNVAIGNNALSNNIIGSSNTAVGVFSMSGNTEGAANTAIGHGAMEFNTIGNSNVAVGYDALRFGSSGNLNSAVGRYSLYNISGSSNVGVGYSAGDPYASGVTFDQCTYVGAFSSPSVSRTNVTMLGYGILNAQCTGNNQVLIGNTAVTQVRSQVQAFTVYSDGRYKTNIKSDVKGLDFITRLNPVSYNVRPKELHKIWGTPDSLLNKIDHSEVEQVRYTGLIAQEVEKAMNESRYDFTGIDIPRNEHETYTLRYTELIMPIIQAIKEQQRMIEELKTANADLQNRISAYGQQNGQEITNHGAAKIISVTPNPAKDKLNLQCEFNKPVESAILLIIDASGKLAMNVPVTGNTALEIPVSTLSSGAYSAILLVNGIPVDFKTVFISY